MKNIVFKIKTFRLSSIDLSVLGEMAYVLYFACVFCASCQSTSTLSLSGNNLFKEIDNNKVVFYSDSLPQVGFKSDNIVYYPINFSITIPNNLKYYYFLNRSIFNFVFQGDQVIHICIDPEVISDYKKATENKVQDAHLEQYMYDMLYGEKSKITNRKLQMMRDRFSGIAISTDSLLAIVYNIRPAEKEVFEQFVKTVRISE